jgi:hypothetical protein
MTTTFNNVFSINGVIDTKNKVLDNLNKIADAAGVWVTFDVNTGLWSIIFNDTDSSVLSFDNSNILGSINVSGTGLTEAYNSATVAFPHKDLRDQTDYIDITIPTEDRFNNELDNTLNIQFDLVNNPVQAQFLGTVELKQSRVDKLIEFRSDYTALGVKAGDVIDVTNDQYGFTNKLFRVTKTEEIDNDDGAIELSIIAIEYDANVYNSSGLIYAERNKKTNILPKITNDAAKQSDDLSSSETILRLLGFNVLTGLLNSAITKNPITGKILQTLSPTSASRDAALSKVKKPGIVITGPSSICEGATLTLTLDLDCSSCLFDPIEYDYTITGVQAADIDFPLTGKVNVPGTMSIPIATDSSVESETLTVTVGTATKAVTINDRLSFTYVTTASPTSITEGASSTVTLTTTGVADGTSVPYAITGSGTGRVSSPLTGTVTVNSNTATLTVTTTDDAIFTGSQTVTVTFNTAQADPCSQLDKTAAITILDNDAAPTTCEFVSVPLIWCAQYNAADDQCQALTAISFAQLPVPLAGESTVAVPTAVSVTKGNPSTVTVTSTTLVAASSSLAGIPFRVITSFNSIAPKGLVTGTGTTIYGYN